MIENNRGTSNPAIKAITAGIFLGGLIASPVILTTHFSKSAHTPAEDFANKQAAYVLLASTIVGSAIGLYSGKRQEKKSPISQVTNSAWQDWREFVVTQKVQESDQITSFYLSPRDQKSIPNFSPGQFLTIKLNLPDRTAPVIRTYSLSDYHLSPAGYRLSVKRESAPPNTDIPPGVASNFMHDHIQENSTLLAKPPAGKFVLDLHSSKPAVLISNGVGITPMITMAKAAILLNSSQHIWFVHGARDGKSHAFRDEIAELAAHHPNLHVIYCYSRPQLVDANKYHHQGYADIHLIKNIVAPEMQKICGSTDADYFICGSPSFMNDLRNGFRDWGVPDQQVKFESFAKTAPKAMQPTKTEPATIPESKEIIFRKSAKTCSWHPMKGTILEFAEANYIYPDYSCRAGVCGTCMSKISEGEVSYEEEPTAQVDPGSVLICIAHPKTAKVVLDL